MRLHITLQSTKQQMLIPMNYAYYISAAIYSFIEHSSPQYSEFLHERGYSIQGTSKHFKHFCFSQLNIPNRRVEGNALRIFSDTIDWYVSMPVDDSLHHFVVGLFERKDFFIGSEENRLAVLHVELLPEPSWERTMKFRMLSPTTVSVVKDFGGRMQPEYLLPDDARVARCFQLNILHKYQSLYNKLPGDDEFHCRFDEGFIEQRGGVRKITKLVTIKEGRSDETKVRGFMCPVTITGNPELIKLAYDSGFGEKGSLGFGMLEKI